MELWIILGTLIFIIGLVTIVVLYSVIRRTVEKVKFGFILILLSIIFLILSVMVELLNIFSNIDQLLFVNFTKTIFIILLILGIWQLRAVIVGLSDFGQVFLLSSQKTYSKELLSMCKGTKNICYVTLEEPYTKIMNLLKSNDLNTSNIYFLDGSGGKCDDEKCIEIKNNPNEIKNVLDRKLKEESFNCVIIDNINALKDIKPFEIPQFVQDVASVIKANEAQGFFIGKKDLINKETINDITMLVDKVMEG